MTRALAIPVSLFLLSAVSACHFPPPFKPQPLAKSKQFVLVGADEYGGELTVALGKEGFIVRPLISSDEAAELQLPAKLSEYREAGYRYALKLNITHNDTWSCMLADGHRVNVVMSVFELGNNNPKLVLKQVGADHDCPPQTSVWDLLARELYQDWQ